MKKKFKDNIYTYSNGSSNDWTGMLYIIPPAALLAYVIGHLVISL